MKKRNITKMETHKRKLKLKERSIKFFFPNKSYLINMELANGEHRSMIVKASGRSFKFNKGVYIIDSEKKYYVQDYKMYAIDYHENLALPIKRQIEVSKIQEGIRNHELSQIEHATDPLTLDTFLTSKIAEGVMKGQAIDEFLKVVKMMIIIILIVCVVHLALFMFKSGMLSEVKGLI